ncbi:hypothetical protein CLV24_10895 [Pontibacter ummariensis]|uniref:DUF5683 domain-containing protein n=1 Tax=Pontibacter ummariensis TaxID=1610492 RepID=A0A239FCI3_9BACT|nr:DUF5683 domain-containing protein [Pontibacter ummariensis]PRY12351.1 hypothetical protein CLV24_10895 [Pontibacter ummariensis]SNS53784.1 hypothetical protein SAMN06296052_10890 [Pontibacter ummariensis]
MRLKSSAAALLFGILFFFAPAISHGQIITEGPDSARVPVPETIGGKDGFFLTRWDRPARAAFYSAVLPGAGQFYNKAYWKIPIIYATGAVLGYFIIDNNNKYQDFRQALIWRTDNDSTTTDQFANDPVLGVARGQIATDNLRRGRDFYRRNRDLTYILSFIAYGLNIAEAYVHAHLKEFDVSDDLALRVQPAVIPLVAGPARHTPGLTFTLYTRSK